MNRKSFIASLGLAGGMILGGKDPDIGSDGPDQIEGELVKQFVVAGHNDLDQVKTMLQERPHMINCSWDWGQGDYETAIEGAGHTGNAEIAGFLIEHGARPNLFTLTMLGEYDLVKTWLEKYPESLFAWGPHGLSLLHHAEKAVRNADRLVQYLGMKGLKVTKFS